ncbi:MAG: hypothetical protein AAF551_02430, partial [Bacteroidota bacterium]
MKKLRLSAIICPLFVGITFLSCEEETIEKELDFEKLEIDQGTDMESESATSESDLGDARKD